MLTIVLFRKDLRLYDNPALSHACERGSIIPLFVLPDDHQQWSLGGASRWWLHHSLQSLDSDLHDKGAKLIVRRGNTLNIVTELCSETGADCVVWNRRYEPASIAEDTALKEHLRKHQICAESFNSHLLNEPWQILNKQGTPFKVFTPFWRHCLQISQIDQAIPEPSIKAHHESVHSEELSALELLPTQPDWSAGLAESWQPGEKSAQQRWEAFLDKPILSYEERRNLPAIAGTSRLSPHLAFGEISVRQLWHDIQQRLQTQSSQDIERYLSELGWREFSYYQLYHFSHITERSFNAKFDSFEWDQDQELLERWQQGQTGYPIVDAGMRELWHTGYMHNRVRMIVASFLCKDLLIHWLEGANWFWDTLVDADLASNTASWQWTAGCGADAAPYFRIFNPVTQSEKFDKSGNYIRRWVPEITALPDKWIHKPWQTPTDILLSSKVTIGLTYPKPIIDHKQARLEALERFKQLPKASN